MMILKIHDHAAPIETVGGKGHNLMSLAAAGRNVPAGFSIATTAFRAWREGGRQVPIALGEQIRGAYEALGNDCAVAVRSSGTAEDLGNASFAGGHETVLDVLGIESVMQAVRTCWDSLEGERVRAYRAQM